MQIGNSDNITDTDPTRQGAICGPHTSQCVHGVGGGGVEVWDDKNTGTWYKDNPDSIMVCFTA